MNSGTHLQSVKFAEAQGEAMAGLTTSKHLCSYYFKNGNIYIYTYIYIYIHIHIYIYICTRVCGTLSFISQLLQKHWNCCWGCHDPSRVFVHRFSRGGNGVLRVVAVVVVAFLDVVHAKLLRRCTAA